MAISKQDYQQWFNTYWVPADDGVWRVTDGLDNLEALFDGSDFDRTGRGFADATEDLSREGLPFQIDAARQLVVAASDNLKLIHTDEQRAVVTPTANATIDLAITTSRRLLAHFEAAQLVQRVFDARWKFGEHYERSLEELKQKYPEREPTKESAQRSAAVYLVMFSKEQLALLWQANRDLKASLQEANDATHAIIGIPDKDLTVREPADDLTVSEPSAVAASLSPIGQMTSMNRQRVEPAVVDNWNEVALKALDQGAYTSFYEIGDIVIIDAGKPGAQPYVKWAKAHPDVNDAAKITLTKKGGAFDQGVITAAGVQNRATFEAAIKRVSKKKLQYT